MFCAAERAWGSLLVRSHFQAVRVTELPDFVPPLKQSKRRCPRAKQSGVPISLYSDGHAVVQKQHDGVDTIDASKERERDSGCRGGALAHPVQPDPFIDILRTIGIVYGLSDIMSKASSLSETVEDSHLQL